MRAKPRLIVIVGPTASGKSRLAVEIAKQYGGEIVSADSRQVYRGMDIGSGKITKREMMGISHHLLDVASPKTRFTVAQYRKLALEAIKKIQKRGKIPILCGGSPFYIYSVVDGWTIPEVKPDPKLRKQLEQLTTEQLLQRLGELDPRRAKTIEAKNKRRLIRALEIILNTGKPVPPLKKYPLLRLRPTFAKASAGKQGFGRQAYPVLFIGIKKSPGELKKLIARRLFKRLKQGMIEEVKKLHREGLSWKRLEEFGLEYRYVTRHLQGKLSIKEMKQKIQRASGDFARRQMSWFRKDKRIKWIKNNAQVKKLLKQFT